MLAEDEIAITIGRETLRLRPTLRAAIRLERRYGGFDKLIEAIDGESVVAMADVMRESATTYSTLPSLIESFVGMTLDKGIRALKLPLIDHVLRLAGHDPDEDQKPIASDAKRTTFAEHHARLFALATGWLGWTPDTAYASTAAEITAAFHGRVEMLKAIFGSTDEASETNTAPSAEAFNSKILAFTKAMGTKKVEAA